MSILKDAFSEVQRNLAPVLLFMAAGLVWGLGMAILHALGGDSDPDALPNQAERLTGLIVRILTAVYVAVFQCICFARMGREIDKPLWKVASDGEALRRFFPMWLMLNLALEAIITTAVWTKTVGQSDGAAEALYSAVIFLQPLLVPAGAAIMFLGSAHFSTLGESFAPLFRQLPKAFVLILANFFLLTFLTFLNVDTAMSTLTLPNGAEVSGAWMSPLIYAAGAYVDCVVLAGVWLICMEDRTTVEDDDLDF